MTRIAIIHPNLGIGGAERLIIDIALSLKRKNHSVSIFTNYYSQNHCFETSNTLNIVKAFDYIPDSIFGGFNVYMSTLKILLLAIYFLIFYSNKFEMVILDQISVISAPILKFFGKKVIFYCHFPDQFLTDRKTIVKEIYRYPIDKLEICCMSYSDLVLVNSAFTQNILLKSFPKIANIYKRNPGWIDILYPCVDEKIGSNINNKCDDKSDIYFVSINRFDPKKMIERAIIAMSQLKAFWNKSERFNVHLYVMGGCDPKCQKDEKYYQDLVKIAQEFEMISKNSPEDTCVTFLKNPDDQKKLSILKNATALIYTPDNEHFGIVPLEAMMMGIPVLASASGGPLESVVDGLTGYHIRHYPVDLVKKMKLLIDDPQKSKDMGQAAREHCLKKFSLETFDHQLETCIKNYI